MCKAAAGCVVRGSRSVVRRSCCLHGDAGGGAASRRAAVDGTAGVAVPVRKHVSAAAPADVLTMCMRWIVHTMGVCVLRMVVRVLNVRVARHLRGCQCLGLGAASLAEHIELGLC